MSSRHDLFEALQSGHLTRRDFIGRALAAGVSFSSISAMLQACGGSASGPNGLNNSIKWSNWAQPGEIERFQAFTANYNKAHKANVQYSFIPTADNNYFYKIMIELEGGVAPDVFYVGDGDIGKLIANQTIADLTPLLASTRSKGKPDDYIQGLWGAARTKSGKIYGVPVDCNPYLLWYNKAVLHDAGITTMPADLFEQGQWTRDTFQGMLEKIHASNKYGYILDDGSVQLWNWLVVNGGTIYDNNGYGNFIAHKDAKALEAIHWLATNIKNKIITFQGSMPKGQGDDLAFLGNQVGFIACGRWFLPEFKTAKGLQYDAVPYPSPDGKLAPAMVALAYIVMNNRSKDQNGAFDFLTNYVSVDGEGFRLQGGGNAVPSIKGPDHVVTDGNDPAHAHYLLDARNVGYALFPAEMGTSGLSDDIKTALQPIWLQGKDINATLAEIAAMADPRIKVAQANLQ